MDRPINARNRRPVRLPSYDYAQAGAYFVTMCTFSRRCLFGDVVDGYMALNDIGDMVSEEWSDLLKFDLVSNWMFSK